MELPKENLLVAGVVKPEGAADAPKEGADPPVLKPPNNGAA